MEVHAHTHTPRKKWAHYFWEFLMLFLAVFCGFLAEYQLEHKIEKERAHQLKKDLLVDLKKDTASLNYLYNARRWIVKRIDSLFNELKGSPAQISNKKVYELSFKIISVFNFKRADGTIAQLKNSGYLRYFSGSTIPITLSEYDQEILTLMNFEKIYGDNLDNYAQEMMIQHFDADILNNSWADYVHGDPVPDSPPLYNLDQNKLNQIRSRLIALKHLNIVCEEIIIGVKEKAKQLMHLL